MLAKQRTLELCGVCVDSVKSGFVRPLKTGAAGFPDRLREARQALRRPDGKAVRQADLGKAVGGLSGQAVGAWETGANEPDLATIERLAALLRVSPGQLAFGDTASDVAQVPEDAPQGRRALRGTSTRTPKKKPATVKRGAK